MMGKYILSCVNGFKPSESVIDYACWISQETKKDLKFFHALDHQFHESESDLSGSIGLGAREDLLKELVEIEHQQNKLLQKKAKLILENAKGKAESKGITDIDLCLREGKLVDNVLELQEKIALVVIGKYGEKHQHNTEANPVGHKVEGLVRKLEKPILIVSEEFKDPTSLCLAYDGSEGSKKALTFLVNSNLLSNLKVKIAYVGKETEEVLEMLKSAKEQLENVSADCSTVVLDGKPEVALNEYLSSNNISILTMGAFGHNWFHDLVMGSLTSKIIRTVKSPILVIR